MSHHRDGFTRIADPEPCVTKFDRESSIRINIENARCEQIKAVLRAYGGRPSSFREARIYVFTTESERDQALDEARCWFGWTCVDPD